MSGVTSPESSGAAEGFSHSRGSRGVERVLGLLLALIFMGAGLLKISELTVPLFFDGDFTLFQGTQLVWALVEIVLGLCWLMFPRPSLSMITAGIVTVFLLRNLWYVSQGFSHCGCFGPLPVASGVAAGLNGLMLLAAVIVGRSQFRREVAEWPAFRGMVLIPWAAALWLGALLPGMVLAGLSWGGVSTVGAINEWLGRGIQPTPASIQIYLDPRADQDLTVPVSFYNNTSRPQKIVGFRFFAEPGFCPESFQIEGVPCDLPPYQSRIITVKFSDRRVDPEKYPEYYESAAEIIRFREGFERTLFEGTPLVFFTEAGDKLDVRVIIDVTFSPSFRELILSSPPPSKK